MAKVIDGDVWDERMRKKCMYPWEEWMDGRTRLLERGVDFECEPGSCVAGARAWGRRHGVRVQIRVKGDLVTLRGIR